MQIRANSCRSTSIPKTNVDMTLKQALTRLRDRDDWGVVLHYLEAERDSALMDFQHGDLIDNPQKLAKLAGEISALDRIRRTLGDESD